MGNTCYFNLSVLIFFSFLVGTNIPVHSQENQITVTCHQNRQNGYDFSYEKNVEGSFLVIVKLNKAINAPETEFRQVVNAASGLLFSVNPLNKNSYLRFSTYDFHYYRGVPDPKVDNSFVYVLPYKKGNTFSVDYVTDQSKCFGNAGCKNYMAFEFSSKECDTVTAVRKGVVVSVVDKYAMDTAVEKSFTSNVNSILVEQQDGTLVHYSGFKKGSIFVTEGQTVFPYTPLGTLSLNETRNLYSLRLMMYYLSDASVEKADNILSKSYRLNLDLLFLTDQGVTKLLSHKPYTSEYNESVLEQEMNKKELKAIGTKNRKL
jgi:hypothetical protein